MKYLAQLGTIQPPPQLTPVTTGTGAQQLSRFITMAINLIMVGSAIAFLFMILWGGFDWITSGGNKDSLAKARGKITNGVIGFVIVALAAVIAQTVGWLFGFDIFGLPHPNGIPCPAGGCPGPF